MGKLYLRVTSARAAAVLVLSVFELFSQRSQKGPYLSQTRSYLYIILRPYDNTRETGDTKLCKFANGRGSKMSTKCGLKAQTSGDPANWRRFKAWHFHGKGDHMVGPLAAAVVFVVDEAS